MSTDKWVDRSRFMDEWSFTLYKNMESPSNKACPQVTSQQMDVPPSFAS